MKTVLCFFIFAMLGFFNSGLCQKTFARGTVEIFDKYETTIKRIGGEKETFRMSLIRNINQTTKDTAIGVNIEVESVKKSELITATGFTITSNFDVGVSSSKVEKKEQAQGSIFLDTDEFLALITFINETIAQQGNEPEYDMGWQLTVEGRFVIGLLYEKDPGTTGQKWKYYIRLDDAEFETSFLDAMEIFRKLSAFQSKINKGLK